MRLSSVQKNTLFLLYSFSNNNRHTVRQRVLYKIITSQGIALFPNNYRASCLTLHTHQLVVRQRDDSNRTWLTMTEAGRALGKKIYAQRLAECGEVCG